MHIVHSQKGNIEKKLLLVTRTHPISSKWLRKQQYVGKSKHPFKSWLVEHHWYVKKKKNKTSEPTVYHPVCQKAPFFVIFVRQVKNKSKSRLKWHLNLHSQETIDCEKCDFKLTKSDSLLNHNRWIHLGVKRKSTEPLQYCSTKTKQSAQS